MLLLNLLACTGDTDTGETPDFTYIPVYDEVCLPPTVDDQKAARDIVDDLIDASEFVVATNMDVCDENSCSPCTETTNPMLGVVRDFDDWGTLEAQALLAGVDGDVDLEAYFAAALDYEWRYLLLSTPLDATGSTTLTLSQGIRAEGELDDWDFNVAHESLDGECEVFQTTMAATKTIDDDGYSLTTGAADEGFGFAVPLTESLPATDSFEDVAALSTWVMSQPTASVVMDKSTVDITWDDETETGCATITGYTASATFGDYASEGGLDTYEDGTETDSIKTVLSLDLTTANVSTWSSR